MTIDEFVKLILALAVAFSIAGISFQIMRLIGKLADSIQDLRTALKNVSNLSDLLVEDYQRIREMVFSVLEIVTNFRTEVLEPISKIFGLVGKVSGVWNRKPKQSDPEEEEFLPEMD